MATEEKTVPDCTGLPHTLHVANDFDRHFIYRKWWDCNNILCPNRYDYIGPINLPQGYSLPTEENAPKDSSDRETDEEEEPGIHKPEIVENLSTPLNNTEEEEVFEDTLQTPAKDEIKEDEPFEEFEELEEQEKQEVPEEDNKEARTEMSAKASRRPSPVRDPLSGFPPLPPHEEMEVEEDAIGDR